MVLIRISFSALDRISFSWVLQGDPLSYNSITFQFPISWQMHVEESNLCLCGIHLGEHVFNITLNIGRKRGASRESSVHVPGVCSHIVF